MKFLKNSMWNISGWYQVEKSPRQSFEKYSLWVQWLITFLSGKPLKDEKPPFWITPLAAIFIDVSKLFIGFISCAIFYKIGAVGYPFIPLSWLLIVNAARSLASDAHYAGHSCVTQNKKIDRWIGEILSTLILSANIRDYFKGHSFHHGRNGIGSAADPDLEPMFSIMGFELGKPKYWYWWRMLLTLVSLRYHVEFLWGRLRSNFLVAAPTRILLAVAFYLSLILLVTLGNAWMLWLVVWVIPMVFLYAISAALQFPSEHLWFSQKDEHESLPIFLRRMSHGRFFLIHAPKSELAYGKLILAWFIWLILMLPKFFGRFFICVSILPAHDYHHRHVRTLDWPMEPYLRQKEIDAGVNNYVDYYSLRAVYKKQFHHWSTLSLSVTELSSFEYN